MTEAEIEANINKLTNYERSNVISIGGWYEHYDLSEPLMRPILDYIRKVTYISNNLKSLDPARDYFQKVHIVGKKLLLESHFDYNELYLHEMKNLTWTVLYVKAIHDVCSISKEKYKVYLYPEVAEVILATSPTFFDGLDVIFIQNNTRKYCHKI